MKMTNSTTLQILNSTSQFTDNYLGSFLYGSQNYELDNQNSDFDIITIVLKSNKRKQIRHTTTGIVKTYTLDYFID
jgi:hypothetical protein